MRVAAKVVVAVWAATLWVPWQMHQTTSTSPDAPPYWYKVWTPDAKPLSAEACLRLVKQQTGRRRVLAIQWYAVRPDAPPDYAKWIGCLPAGFDPEDPPK